MKLLLYILLATNLVLGVLGWLDMRKIKLQPVYIEDRGVKLLRLLADRQVLAESVDQCWLFGPLSSEGDASEIKAEVSKVDYFARLLTTDVVKAPGYWVYFGPIEEYAESLRQLREFQSKGIDSFIISKEALRGSISLGVFENIDSAKRMQAIMLRKGYQTKMAEIPKLEKEFWVSLKFPSGGPLESQFQAIASRQNKALEVRQIFCK